MLDASWVTNATHHESIKLTQRFAAMSTSVSQEQSHTYTSSWTSRLLRRAPVHSEHVIDEEQNPGDPPPRPHLPTLAAPLQSEHKILLFSERPRAPYHAAVKPLLDPPIGDILHC